MSPRWYDADDDDAGDLASDPVQPPGEQIPPTATPGDQTVADMIAAAVAKAKAAQTPTVTTAPPSGPDAVGFGCVWKHADPRGTANAIASAFERARTGAWAGEGTWGSVGIADARAMAIATLILIDWLSRREPTIVGDALNVGERGDQDFDDPTRLKFANALQVTWGVVRKKAAELGVSITADDTAIAISTTGGNAPTVMLGKAAGFAFAWPAAVAVTATVVSVAWIWTSASADSVTVSLSKERTARMMATQARLIELLGNHRQREKDSGGGRLPWTQEEIDAFQALVAAQNAAYAGDAQHDRDVPRGGLLGGVLGDGKPGGTLATVASGIGTVAIALVAYAALRRG